jgi:F-type H+-transporting ATPase subunit delta
VNISQSVARVYAKALFDIGTEEGNLGQIYDDLRGIQAVADSGPEEGRFMNSPKLQREDKKRVLDAVFAEHVSRPVMGLMHILVDKRREPVFDNIVAEFAKYRDEHEGRAHATVTTAQPLPDDEKARLVAALAKQTGKEIDLHEKINPAVIGGIRVNLGDSVLDGTVRRRLNELRRSFAAEQG